MTNQQELMKQAAFEALENGWPFSHLATRLVRYLGKDKKIVRMMVEQAIARTVQRMVDFREA